MYFRDVVMHTADPAAAREFYGRTLELPVTGAADEVAVRAGQTTLRFRRADAGTAPTYHFALRIAGDQFTEAKAWLAERVELVREDGQDEFDWRDFWGALAAYFYDPAGNILEVMAFPELGPARQGAFGGGSFVGVAELGLPVADPLDAIERLSETFGIGLWDGDEPDPARLTPVGEQGATFLVSPIGRRWLFGDDAAPHPLDVELAGVRAGSLLFEGLPYRIVGR